MQRNTCLTSAVGGCLGSVYSFRAKEVYESVCYFFPLEGVAFGASVRVCVLCVLAIQGRPKTRTEAAASEALRVSSKDCFEPPLEGCTDTSFAEAAPRFFGGSEGGGFFASLCCPSPPSPWIASLRTARGTQEIPLLSMSCLFALHARIANKSFAFGGESRLTARGVLALDSQPTLSRDSLPRRRDAPHSATVRLQGLYQLLPKIGIDSKDIYTVFSVVTEERRFCELDAARLLTSEAEKHQRLQIRRNPRNGLPSVQRKA